MHRPTLLLAVALALSGVAAADEFDIPAQAVETFARSFQDALAQKDVARVTAMVGFPLRVNAAGRKSRRVNRAQFETEFDQIFTPAVIREVMEQDPAHLFQNYQGVMFGNGAVWASESCDGRRRPDCPLRVITVNRPAP